MNNYKKEGTCKVSRRSVIVSVFYAVFLSLPQISDYPHLNRNDKNMSDTHSGIMPDTKVISICLLYFYIPRNGHQPWNDSQSNDILLLVGVNGVAHFNSGPEVILKR